jgi:hypothetical protein
MNTLDKWSDHILEIERLRAINAELLAALNVLLIYVDEQSEDGMTVNVETELARAAIAKEQP